ncbi:MAG: hypothetical protein HWN67_17865 [Candidatus Helarchaeota archaeon]|nr:hypothetical protein [Candidatus Helarchaeota archaeon]
MSNKKGKIEINFDEKGKVKKLTFGEEVSTSKIMEIVNNIRNPQDVNLKKTADESYLQNIQKNENLDLDNLSIMDKLMLIIKRQMKYGWFTSKDIQEFYQVEYREDVKISTISTYLSRMFEDKTLDRRGSRKRREYRLITEKVEQIPLIEE